MEILNYSALLKEALCILGFPEMDGSLSKVLLNI